MKKLLITFVIIGGYSINSHAGLISHTDYQSGAVITAAGQNSNENTIFNEFNGNIDDNNIKGGANITLSKLAALSAQVVVFTNSSGVLTSSTATLTGPLVISTGVTISGPVVIQQNTTSSGTITFSNTVTQGIVGEVNGTETGLGFVGQISSTAVNTATFAASTHLTDITNITLPAGDWIINGFFIAQCNSVSNITRIEAGITTTSGDSSSGLVDGDNHVVYDHMPLSSTDQWPVWVNAYRVNPTSSTTYYLKAGTTFTGAAGQGKGKLIAIRIH